MAYTSFAAQPTDYSFIAQAGAQVGSAIQQLPAAKEAMEKRKRFEENLQKLKLRKEEAEGVRQQRVIEMVDEYKNKMGLPEVDDRMKTKIEAMFMSKTLLGDDVDASLKLMSDNDTKFETWLSNQALDKNKKDAASSAEMAAKGGREYGPEVDTGRGFTEQTLERQVPPAQYQEQAMAQYGEMASRGEAPLQSTKELEQQPSIAALPKTPPQQKTDPLFDLKKRNLELRNATEMAREAALRAAAARDRNKGTKEGVDDAIKTVMNQRFSLDRSIRDDSKLISSLNNAINKIESGKADASLMQELSSAGYSGPMDDVNVLKDALIQTQKDQEQKKYDLKDLKNTEKVLIKGGTGPLATGRRTGGELTQDQYTEALKAAALYIKNNVSPGVLRTGTMDKVISFLPPEHKQVMQQKVDELRGEGHTDVEIRKWLSQ